MLNISSSLAAQVARRGITKALTTLILAVGAAQVAIVLQRVLQLLLARQLL
jgi:hypothetical protein